MPKAKDLLSERVVVGMADERLLNVSARIRQRRAYYCVVLTGPGRYLGLIGLKEVASLSNPGNRILADLIDQSPLPFISHDTPASAIADLFEREGIQEAIVLSAEKTYLGVVTSDQLFAWARAEQRAHPRGPISPPVSLP